MDRLTLLADCGRQLWRLQLGDPDPLGLALTAGYLLVLALMLRLVLRPPPGRFRAPRDRQLWVLVLTGFTLLTANKQLDLQHYAMDVGRCYASARGWYAKRAGLEHQTALVLLAASLALFLALGLWFGRVLSANLRLILGLALLVAYVLLQMTDALHLDQHLQSVVNSLALHRGIEALALTTLGWAAWCKARSAEP